MDKNEFDLLKQIKSLKYLIADDNIISMNEGEYSFNLISKKYFANTTDMPWIK